MTKSLASVRSLFRAINSSPSERPFPNSVMLNTMLIEVKDQIGLLKDFKYVKLQNDKILIIESCYSGDHGHHHQAGIWTIKSRTSSPVRTPEPRPVRASEADVKVVNAQKESLHARLFFWWQAMPRRADRR